MKRNKIVVFCFLILICIPFCLGVGGKVLEKNFDVALRGYTDAVKKPEFSWKNFVSGNYQSDYASWYEANFMPHGVLTKTYGTIQYHLFHIANRPLGKGFDVYQNNYIDAELCLKDEYDFSILKNRDKLTKFIADLEETQKKLAKFDKYLYIYIAPSKADFNHDSLPDKYVNIADNDYIKGVDCFRELIKDSSVPYLISADMKDQLAYPAFYTTGIHWSDTFRKLATQAILQDLSRITGKHYRNVYFDKVKTSSSPFWWDDDVFNLLNIWNKPDILYYDYSFIREYPERFDRLRLLLQGDSFGEGTRKDIQDFYPYEDVYFLNRNRSIIDNKNNTQMIESWDHFDWQYYLDAVDIIVIEMTEPEIKDCSNGFIEQLNSFLDGYIPSRKNESVKIYQKNLQFDSQKKWSYDGLYGVHNQENGHVWVKPYSKVILKNHDIAEKGVEIRFAVPKYVFHSEGSAEITIYINGTKVYFNDFDEAWEGSIFIDAEQLQTIDHRNDLYEIEVFSSKSFVPKDLGINSDTRDLALSIRYMGEIQL